MKRLIICIAATAAMAVQGQHHVCAQTPDTVLGNVIEALDKSSGIECSFTAESGGRRTHGIIKSDGRMFTVFTPESSTWFDGTTMWTANPSTHEITVITPTEQELLEVNPFSSLHSYKSHYATFMSRRRDPDRHLVLLNPKGRKSGVKAIEVGVSKKRGLPDRFIVRDDSDRVVTVSVSGLRTDRRFSPGTFKCPVKDMPGYEVVDLR